MSLGLWNPNSVFGGLGGFGGFDEDFFNMPSGLMDIPPSLTRFPDDTMRHSSPRYEVTENDKQFRLAVDVPGVKPDHMKIELENNGRVLHISGDRKDKTDKTYKAFKFEKRFTLGRNLDTSKIEAHLSDGVLVLTAPKMEKLPPITQNIKIIQGEPPALMDVEEENKTDKKVE
jgi:HSP20 family protein